MNNSTARIQIPLGLSASARFPEMGIHSMLSRGWRIAQRTAERSKLSSTASGHSLQRDRRPIPDMGRRGGLRCAKQFAAATMIFPLRGNRPDAPRFRRAFCWDFLPSWQLAQGLTRFQAALAALGGRAEGSQVKGAVSAWQLPRSLCASARYNGAERR